MPHHNAKRLARRLWYFALKNTTIWTNIRPMRMTKFSLFFLALLFTTIGFSANRDFHTKTGRAINGELIKYFEDGTVLLKRSSDNQLFRIDLSIFTLDDQAFVKNNFPPNHDALPTFSRPLSERDLAINAQYIDNLILGKLRSYNQRPNKEISNETFLRRAYLKIIGRIPTLEETQRFLAKDRKRSQLIDELLSSEDTTGYIYWADILRAKTRVNNKFNDGYPFVHCQDSVLQTNPTTWGQEMSLPPAQCGKEEMESSVVLPRSRHGSTTWPTLAAISWPPQIMPRSSF